MAAADEVEDRAESLLARIAEPIFEAAEVEPELRFHLEIEREETPRAVLVDRDEARISTGLVRIATAPEELAAVAAYLIAVSEIDGPRRVFSSGYRVTTRPPTKDAYSGAITSLDEALAQRSESAAEDTLKRRGGFGPSTEEIRATARRRDALAVEILRRAGLSSEPLRALYERIAAAGHGLLDRDDFEGRKILGEQVKWLADRTEPQPARTAYWSGFDAELAAVKALLGED